MDATDGRPLDGIRVLDAGDFLAAPFCAMLLGDLGADVIKVEPLSGDTLRSIGELVAPPDLSAMFVSGNRGKRSVSLDRGSEAGRALLRDLASASDVVVHNRPGPLHTGLPAHVIVASVTAFGEHGPYRERGGVDPIAQAMAGLAAVTGERDGPPMRSGVTMVDFGAGMMLACAAIAALYRRERTGRGGAVSTSLLDIALTFGSSLYPLADALGAPPPRLENRSHAMLADQFAACDGFVVLAVWDSARWHELCELLDLDDLANDERLSSNAARLARYDQVRPVLQDAIARWSASELVTALAARRIPCAQTYDATQAARDPHVQAIEAIYEESRLGPLLHMVAGALRLDGARQQHAGPPPRLGEHSDEVLQEVLGLDVAARDRLAEQGVVRRAATGPAPAPR